MFLLPWYLILHTLTFFLLKIDFFYKIYSDYDFPFLLVQISPYPLPCQDPLPLCITLEANKNLRNNNKSKKTKYNKIKSKQTPAREAGRYLQILTSASVSPT